MTPLLLATLPSPVGTLTLAARGGRLVAVLWEDDGPRRVPLGPGRHVPDDPVLTDVAGQLSGYFAGTCGAFDLPLAFTGTPFQRSVWNALLAIPFGETRNYGQLAYSIAPVPPARSVPPTPAIPCRSSRPATA